MPASSTSSVAFANTDAKMFASTTFTGTPLMEVARCESTYRQYDKDGAALRGIVNPADIGIMQINQKYHQDTARKLGFDIFSARGNILYAKWLYDHQGLQPWSASRPCWEDKTLLAVDS